MRHLRRGRKFGRVRKVRRALLRSLLSALILKDKIRTTEAKAREIRPLAEKLVTQAKKGTLASRREVLKKIPDPRAVKKLFSTLGPKYLERPGGYTRLIKLGQRKSDGAKMAIIEFV